MIIQGSRSGGAKALAAYLLRLDHNESVAVHDIDHYPQTSMKPERLFNFLKLMETIGRAKGVKRNLYHAIIALPFGERLGKAQIKKAVDLLAEKLGLTNHACAIVEHHKARRQHFHVVFNILHPLTGKQAKLVWSRTNEWKAARMLETLLGLKSMLAKGRSIRRWELKRGKLSGIDPLKVRAEVTALYRNSRTAPEFVKGLQQAGYILTIGRHGSFVLVDKAGDIHGLMRRIEGARLKELNRKFPDLAEIKHSPLADIVKVLRPRHPLKLISLRKQSRYMLSRINGEYRPRLARQPAMPKLQSKARVPAETSMKSSLRVFKQVTESQKKNGRSSTSGSSQQPRPSPEKHVSEPVLATRRRRPSVTENRPMRRGPNRAEIDRAELIAWAIENGRDDILAQFGIYTPDQPDPG